MLLLLSIPANQMIQNNINNKSKVREVEKNNTSWQINGCVLKYVHQLLVHVYAASIPPASEIINDETTATKTNCTCVTIFSAVLVTRL